jgi:hypothetical protein
VVAPDAGVGDAGGEEPNEEPPGDALSFEADVLPILADNCGPCHTTNSTAGHSVGGDLPGSYEDAVRLGDTLLQRIDGDGMPPGCTQTGVAPCLSEEEVQTVADWIDQGSEP